MVSRKARRFIGRKIRQQRHHGKPQKQAVAIGYSEARRKGFKVPKKKNPGGVLGLILGEAA